MSIPRFPRSLPFSCHKDIACDFLKRNQVGVDSVNPIIVLEYLLRHADDVVEPKQPTTVIILANHLSWWKLYSRP